MRFRLFLTDSQLCGWCRRVLILIKERHVTPLKRQEWWDALKKADFDWANASQKGFDSGEYAEAREYLASSREILEQHSDVITGYWVGSRNGDPYIMVAIEEGKVAKPGKLLPDTLGEYPVYYVEGHPHL